MNKEKVVEILKNLASDSGLDSPENWDSNEETQKWRVDAIEALKYATKMLEAGNFVGTLNLNGKDYKISE